MDKRHDHLDTMTQPVEERRDRKALGIEDFTEADAEAVRRARPSPERQRLS